MKNKANKSRLKGKQVEEWASVTQPVVVLKNRHSSPRGEAHKHLKTTATDWQATNRVWQILKSHYTKWEKQSRRETQTVKRSEWEGGKKVRVRQTEEGLIWGAEAGNPDIEFFHKERRFLCFVHLPWNVRGNIKKKITNVCVQCKESKLWVETKHVIRIYCMLVKICRDRHKDAKRLFLH